MCGPGIGESVRRASLCGGWGTTNGTGPDIGPTESARTNADADGAESRPSEAAQQLSARDWDGALASCESDSCIGHASPSKQQAIRASGVAIQPAQTAGVQAASASTIATAARRLLEVSIL